MNEIGEKIKASRKEAGLTQEILALQCGVSKPTLIDLERGQGNVTLETLLKVLRVLNLNLALQPMEMSRSPTLSQLKEKGVHEGSAEQSARAGFKRK